MLRFFKALAEEAQIEKAKALTLTHKVRNLTDELKEKDKEIENVKLGLKSTPQNVAKTELDSLDQDLTEKIKFIEQELIQEKLKSSALTQQLQSLTSELYNQQRQNEISQKKSAEAEIINSRTEDLMMEIESLKEELTNKGKEIEQLKTVYGNSENRRVTSTPDRLNKALAEEAQLAKSKSLTLTREVENLKENLLEKEMEIDQLKKKLNGNDVET